MNAYDYEKQEWVSGDDARRLRAEQIREELALLKGPRAAEYWRMLGAEVQHLDMGTAIATLEMELAGLDGLL